MNGLPRQVLPKDMAIAWGDNSEYWRVTDTATLRSVCWFDMAATFENMFLGAYNVVLKGEGDGDFNFCCSVTTKGGVELNEKESEELSTENITPEGWACAIIPIMREEETSVTVRLYNHSGSWKHGLTLHSIALEPIVQNRFMKTKRALH